MKWMSGWHSLYGLNSEASALAAQLAEAAVAAGYAAYNPFGLMPARSYKRTLRLFVAPQGDWTRVIGEIDAALLPVISRTTPLLWLGLAGSEATIAAWSEGEAIDVAAFAARWLPHADVRAVERAWHDAPLTLVKGKRESALPVQILPVNIQDMAEGVDAAQASKMFERISGDLMKKVGGSASDARALLQQPDAPDWASAGAARVRAMAAALHLPDDWDTPDFVTLRDAYQVAARRQRKPDAPLYPGDGEALAAVPNALAYTPVFYGKDA
jgi:hypothetical protein